MKADISSQQYNETKSEPVVHGMKNISNTGANKTFSLQTFFCIKLTTSEFPYF